MNNIVIHEQEAKVLKRLILKAWHSRSCLSFSEQLAYYGEEEGEPSEEWLEYVIESLTNKLGIEPEEMW